MSLIFFAMAIQDEKRGYVDIWTKKIIDNFGSHDKFGCGIIDISEVEKQIVEDEKGISLRFPGRVYKIYGGEWRSWDDLYFYEKKYFFPLIEKSDFVVAAEAWNHPRRGKYTAKVIVEIEYALSNGKKVFGINIENWVFKEITKEDFVKIKKEKEDEIIFVDFLRRSL